MLNAGMNCFLDQDDIIRNVPPFYKSSLVFQDDDRKDLFNPICNDFGDDFISNIAHRDRSEPI